MTRRERVEATLNHQPVDRVALLEQLSYNPRVVADWTGRAIAGFDYTVDDICHVIRQTMDLIMPPVAPRGTGRDTTADGFVTQRDNWTTWRVSRPFTDEHGAAQWLQQRTAQIQAAPFDPARARADYRRQMLDLQARIGDTVILNYSHTGFCSAFDAMGLEIFTFFQLEYPEVLKQHMETATANEIRRVHAVADPALSPVILVPEDFATVHGPIFGPDFLSVFHYPYIGRVTEAWHEHGVHVIYHSDGNWKSVIPDLMACGVDGFYCLEPNCGMDIVELKNTWPDMVWAGGVDGVDLMERGSPEEVMAQVRRHIRETGALGSGGMFVASSSEINPPIPPESFRAMVETVHAMRHPEATGTSPLNAGTDAGPPEDVPGVGSGSPGPGDPRAPADWGRPQYALESHEDEVYHELRLPELGTEPEYCAFLDQTWVFNQAMQWHEALGDTLICACEGGDLSLTGQQGVSRWFSDPGNSVELLGSDTTRFTRRSPRQRDCVVLPALQFHLEQHPRLDLVVSAATTDWQLCILVKGRAGPPLVASPWQCGPGSYGVDVRQVLRQRGFDLHYAELHFAVGLWNAAPHREDVIDFSLRLRAAPAIVSCLPVIRHCGSVEAGVPVSAIVTDASGSRVGRDAVSVTARIGERAVPLAEDQGIWSAHLPTPAPGDHLVRLICEGAVGAQTHLSVRITEGGFLGYDRERHLMVRDGKPLGPLSGSYQGLVYVRDAGGNTEALVNGQDAFAAWDRARSPGEHWHYWEALTQPELEERFAFLARNGWALLHLCQHWGLWKRLDAGGRLAPHAAEQLALYYRVAAQHGLSVAQALSHYPYGSRHTPPWQSYADAGYADEDWQHAGSAFSQAFHRYLADFAVVFGGETAIAYMTTSGEGDIAAGPERVNDTGSFLRCHAPHHLFLSEPIHRMQRLPDKHTRGWPTPAWLEPLVSAQDLARWRETAWKQPLFGSRLYWVGTDFEPELDLGIEFKLIRLGPVFAGEGSWPNPHRYADFTQKPNTWCGSPEYRLRVRDSLYLGLVHRIPMLLTWEEQLTEDEHRLLGTVRSQIDWDLPFQPAPVAIRVDDANVGEHRDALRQYEELFSALPLATRYLAEDEPAPAGTELVLDARAGYGAPPWAARQESIPDALRARMPISISPGYRAAYAWSRDRRALLAYVYNCTDHIRIDHRPSLGGCFHRHPRPTELCVHLHNFPAEPGVARAYDLDRKICAHEEAFSESHTMDLDCTGNDVLIVVTPPGNGGPCARQ